MIEQTFSEEEIRAIAVVDKQLEAYNARDIDQFAATYHDDIELYSLSKGIQPVLTGKESLKQEYGEMFASLKYLHASSLKRIVHGRHVIIHEFVEQSMDTDDANKNKIPPTYKVVAAYEVEAGLIRRVTFMY